MNFSEEDKIQIKNKCLTLDIVRSQIEVFKNEIPFVNLKKAATIENGILKFNSRNIEEYVAYFDLKRDAIKIVKFVPASGAATRMFKFLFDFLKNFKPDEESINAYINRNKASNLSIFLVGLKKFPFYYKVKQQLYKSFKDFDDFSTNHQLLLFVKTMLHKHKLDYGNYPKGLFPFHQYKDHIATAFEEHLFEAALYASANKKADLHFTISEKHNHNFDEEFRRIEEIVERKTNTEFNITYSFQKQSTDTIAVTKKNEPFRELDGSLLFRPSGHGALIENLNEIEADIVFIKNIDNVIVHNFTEEVSKYKKTLAGLLLTIQKQTFAYAEILEQEINEEKVLEIATFLSNNLNVVINHEFEKYSLKYKVEYLKGKLNRPIRVCGMVKNEGEPGGGPFWVKSESGSVTLQIVESAQVDIKNKNQREILNKATHFNPVDLVCGIRNYKGEKFDLTEFVDYNTAFISPKTKSGKELMALERPGLWNGAMAKWNTIFVEVPLITFSPVKTVNDLLKSTHQVY